MLRTLAALAVVSLPALAYAATPITAQRVATSLDRPVYATHAPSDPSRLFIVEQGSGSSAAIKILNLTTGTVSATPFLTVTGLSTSGEQGLLGLAFDPNYATNGRFYTYSTNNLGDNEVRRYTVSGNPNVANTAFSTVLNIPHPTNSNHNGGWIAFNPKLTPTTPQYLHIATGDGGAGNDPPNNAQNRASLLGKILRLDVSGASGYTVPPTNPFAGDSDPTTIGEVYSYGLRNPSRDSFDRQTGDLWIGDVGQDTREEVNFLSATHPTVANFGWRLREGTIQTPGVGGAKPPFNVDPVHDYANPGTAAVVGGYVYRGLAIPDLQGEYFFADSYIDNIWSLRSSGQFVANATNRTTELDPGTRDINFLVSFGEDANGELYIMDYGTGANGTGEVFKIVAVPEPGTTSLLAVSALALFRRRRH
jgi:glucose/arabinose dehydrogenase